MPSSLLLAAMATIMTVSISWVGAQTNCKDRCGLEFYRGYMCQCDYGCLAHEECCTDYESQCTQRHSCKGRCGEAFKRGRRCTCDPECIKFSNCCPDYKNHCDAAAEDEAELQKWTSADDPLISPVAPQDNYDEFSNDFYEPNFPNLPDDPLSKEDFETTSVPKPTQAILPDMGGSDLTKPFNQDIAQPDSDLQTRQEFVASGTDGYETIEPSVPLIYPTDSTTYPDLTTNPTESTTTPDLTTNPTDSTTTPDLTTNPAESTTTPDLTTNPTDSTTTPDTESTTTPDLSTNPTESTTTPDLTTTPDTESTTTPDLTTNPTDSTTTPDLTTNPTESTTYPDLTTNPTESTTTPDLTTTPDTESTTTPDLTTNPTESTTTPDLTTNPTESTTYPDLTTNPTESTTTPDLTTTPDTESTTTPDLTTNPTESTTTPDLTTNPTESTTTPDLTTNPTESTTYPDLTTNPTESTTYTDLSTNPTESTTYPDLTTNPAESTTTPDLTTNPTESTTTPDLTTNPAESTTYPYLTTNPTESPTYPDLTTNPTESTTYPDLTMTPTSRVDVTPSVVPGTTGATQAYSSSEASTSSVPTPSSAGPQSDTLSTLPPSTTDPTVKGNQEEGRVSSTPTTSEPTTTPQARPNRPLPNRLTPAANKPSWVRPTPKPNQRPSYQADDSNDMNLCSGRPVGAVTTLGNGTIVVFRGHYFWLLDRNRVPGPARRITQVWGVPSPVDTAFTRCNCQGKTYIFKGSLYWRFHNDVVDPGYPKFIHHGFDGLRGQITAALSVPQYQSRRESVYFFKRGGLVQKYSYQLGTGSTCGKKRQYSINIVRHRMARQAVSVLEPSIRISMSWRGFPTSVTSAVSIPSRRTPEGYKYYVFSRSKYYNVQMNTPQPAIVVPPVQAAPQHTSNAFFRCP
ncbi:proteoglycan 4b [Gadus chalcogrammus]|uniref:proteoglycan 4b n=1 Tax=Gadus chalcogrammus TaxID=1042646 RepID=UPI0024C4DF47|nr:proteoglycan 4b [Gadus chalcogrammus]